MGQREIRYDGLGNVVDGVCPVGPARFQITRSGQLLEAVTARGTTRYAYDALGRRIRKDSNGESTHYVWAGQQLLSEAAKRNGVKTREREYLFIPGAAVPLAMREDGSVYYFHCGRRFDVQLVTDERGKIVWQGDCTAFGEARIVREEVTQPWRLAGQLFDEETGFHYSLGRYYDPRVGRYLSRDPLFREGGSNNFYIYCDGDPPNRSDPTGGLIFAILIGAAIGAAVGAGLEAWRQKKEIDAGRRKGYDGWGIAKSAAIYGAIGAAGGYAGAAIEGAFAAGITATVVGGAGVGGISGMGASIFEQCAQSALTGEPLDMGKLTYEAIKDGILGMGIGAVTGGAGGWLARRARKGAEEVAEEVLDAARPRALPPGPPPPRQLPEGPPPPRQLPARGKSRYVQNRLEDLSRQGHGPQRHEGQITDEQLRDRCMNGKDPMTGTTADGVTGLTHKYGRNATKINSPEDFVHADDFLRSSDDFKKAAREAEITGENVIKLDNKKLEDIYGPDYAKKISGQTRTGSKNNPQGSAPTDFTDGTMKAIYKRNDQGSWDLITMYPESKP